MKTILFDLDNTLYPPERLLFNLIDVRINRYMQEVAGIAASEVDGLRRRYWRDYGVTLQGLIRHHGVDPEDYLIYVHDVDVASLLFPMPALRRHLEDLPHRRMIFTNGSRCHADRVVAALGLDGLFEQVFDIRVAGYLPKPCRQPYESVLRQLGASGGDCIMVEDSADNLRTAKELGMRTVLVGGTEPAPAFVDAHIGSIEQIAAAVA